MYSVRKPASSSWVIALSSMYSATFLGTEPFSLPLPLSCSTTMVTGSPLDVLTAVTRPAQDAEQSSARSRKQGGSLIEDTVIGLISPPP